MNDKANMELETLKNNLHKEVKTTKKQYYQDIINSLNSKTIFLAIR